METTRSASVWAQRLGIGVVVAIIATFALRVGASESQQVDFRDLTVWLPSSATGEVVLAHAGSGTSGEIVSRVVAGAPGESISAVQVGSGALVLNRTKGEVAMVDSITLTMSQRAPLAGADGRSQLVSSDAGARVVTNGAVYRIDPATGIPSGTTRLTKPLTGAVADAAGVVYGLDSDGRIVVVGESTSTLEDTDQVRVTGVVAASGIAFAVNRNGPSLVRLDENGLGERACLAGAFPADSSVPVHVGGSSDGEPIVIVVDDLGGVRIHGSDNDCVGVDLQESTSRFGRPVTTGGFVYVPLTNEDDESEVIVLSVRDGSTVGRYGLDLPPGRPFDLIEKDGTVWFNDPNGNRAGVLGRTAVDVVVDKRATPGDGPSSVDGSGGPAATGATGSTGAPVESGQSGATGEGGTTTGVGSETGASGASGGTGGDGGGDGSPTGDGNSEVPRSDAGPGSAPIPSADDETRGLVADFEYSSRSVAVGETVTFTEDARGNPTAWTWEFGDGTFSTGTRAEHSWAQPGVYTVTLTIEKDTNTARASVAITVVAPQTLNPPSADFQFSAARVEVGDEVTFTDRSTGDPKQWQWNFGDGSGASGREVKHAFSSAGTYNVKLTASNTVGSDTSEPATITVYDRVEEPIAVISGAIATATVGQSVVYTSQSTGNPTSLHWDFGDNTGANGSVAQKVWAKAGTYTVTLEAANSAGSSTASTVIVVNDVTLEPEARFTMSQASAETGQAIQFQSLSTNSPTRLSWQFGDGGTATGAAVTHTYTSPGSYEVTLTADNSAGSDYEVKTLNVVAQLPPPVAAFSFSPTTITTLTAVQFVDESSGGEVTTRSWNFGDGTNLVAQRNPSHIFPSVGTFSVTLTVNNAKGSSTAQRNITVLPAPPVADFTFSPITPLSGQSVQFTDISGGGQVERWLWDFGGGNTSTAKDPTFAFARNGSYDVRLTVTNASGSTSKVRRVEVNPLPPVALFDFAPTSPTTDTPVSFTNRSTGGAASSIRWDFGDGTAPATIANPTHTFTAPGTYSVELTMSNVTATNKVIRQVVVTVPPPSASFDVSATRIAGAAITFTNTSGGGPFSAVRWQFGDGTAAATSTNATHTFAAAGSYNVTLRVTNGGGVNETTVRITVAPQITAAFSVSSPRVAGSEIRFTNVTTPTSEPLDRIEWVFGDGTTGSGASIGHVYSAAGTYPVTLNVRSVAGATSTITTNVVVAPAPPVASFTYSPVAGSPARTVRFESTSTGVLSSYTWNFGDGTPTVSGATVQHTFPTGTSFDVTLTVANLTGPNSTTRTVSMAASVAAFTDSSSTSPSPVTFNNTSTNGPFTSVRWDFGDGATGSGASVNHAYPASGEDYVVVLTVVNGLGTYSATRTITSP